VKTIFGFSYRPHQIIKRGRERTEVSKAVQAKSYDFTVFRLSYPLISDRAIKESVVS
jgi:hypothetical protein